MLLTALSFTLEIGPSPPIEPTPTPTATATALPTPTPPPSPTPAPKNGYWLEGLWTPGWISEETWRTTMPIWVVGNATFYSPYLMRATAEYRGMDLTDFVDGVSLFSPSDIGDVVWLKPPDSEWEGPYLVVDCAEQDHMYPAVVHKGEVVEVSWGTAQRWGLVQGGKIASHRLDNVQVSKLEPSQLKGSPVYFKQFFLETLIWR